jgi:hypothetical protein
VYNPGMMRTLIALALLSSCLHAPGIPRQVGPAEIARPEVRTVAEQLPFARQVLRALTQEIWQLGGAADARHTEREFRRAATTGAFQFESRGPAEGGYFQRTPVPLQAIEEAFSRYCGGRRPMARRKEGDLEKISFAGLEPRSGADCALEVESDARGRWRFMLRLSGR